MNEQLPARARRVVRNAAGRAVRLGSVPIRPAAHVALRIRPGLESRVSRMSWLWRESGGRLPAEYLDATHAAILRALGDAPVGRVLEIGCGDGLLTERLAPGADAIVATDTDDHAVARAAARFHLDRQVRVERRALPFDRLDGTFDLIVCADSLHHWDAGLARRGLERLLARLRPGGRLLLLHHLGAGGGGAAVHHAAAVRIGADARFGHERAESLPGLGPDGSGVRLDVVRRAGATVVQGGQAVTGSIPAPAAEIDAADSSRTSVA
ncbi:MAG: class I SAM-dependent methyltransferase [Pseudonocardia sp.]|nr:class I SAM-dependent methyltransferase [Pseudonocardia sp.]